MWNEEEKERVRIEQEGREEGRKMQKEIQTEKWGEYSKEEWEFDYNRKERNTG